MPSAQVYTAFILNIWNLLDCVINYHLISLTINISSVHINLVHIMSAFLSHVMSALLSQTLNEA